MVFSTRLRQARIDSGLSQQALAEKLGVKQGTYFVYERKEKPQMPSVEIAAKLAKICNVSLDYLAGLIDEPRPLTTAVEETPAAVDETPASKSDLQALQAQIDEIKASIAALSK